MTRQLVPLLVFAVCYFPRRVLHQASSLPLPARIVARSFHRLRTPNSKLLVLRTSLEYIQYRSLSLLGLLARWASGRAAFRAAVLVSSCNYDGGMCLNESSATARQAADPIKFNGRKKEENPMLNDRLDYASSTSDLLS